MAHKDIGCLQKYTKVQIICKLQGRRMEKKAICQGKCEDVTHIQAEKQKIWKSGDCGSFFFLFLN